LELVGSAAHVCSLEFETPYCADSAATVTATSPQMSPHPSRVRDDDEQQLEDELAVLVGALYKNFESQVERTLADSRTVVDIRAQLAALPDRSVDVIFLDFPVQHYGRSQAAQRVDSVDLGHDFLRLPASAIQELSISRIAAPNCLLITWTSACKDAEIQEQVAQLGFAH
jgi:hypothetical protein